LMWGAWKFIWGCWAHQTPRGDGTGSCM